MLIKPFTVWQNSPNSRSEMDDSIRCATGRFEFEAAVGGCRLGVRLIQLFNRFDKSNGLALKWKPTSHLTCDLKTSKLIAYSQLIRNKAPRGPVKQPIRSIVGKAFLKWKNSEWKHLGKVFELSKSASDSTCWTKWHIVSKSKHLNGFQFLSAAGGATAIQTNKTVHSAVN